ncbi:hypothetical protein [Bradyrhizobium sp. AUGA SZCCT0182]|uniref:hypothetical protein n=1 Tax=Bradyrhizobium sp. AUGA SZCCT0182 TaxID=2807667 RepID=UPI001BA4AAB3|nr:hypothetical protein [Bradyrhizobium sp. AUGA SZCCT0182]MBR1231770.1 hypothetical protein [Bradyrhizobium sp. AUGA SZCCT0182]
MPDIDRHLPDRNSPPYFDRAFHRFRERLIDQVNAGGRIPDLAVKESGQPLTALLPHRANYLTAATKFLRLP